ncbi:extracellular elastinolytic metallo proteinase precursor [Periconia macrospinosa]|uniref:Extracellular metalloproteinase n=1 Tax=Periconia macrospinosa TaxID=97972 RepID=A0A2V1DY29_9PLEO|nr:extracellular elastinolytic metallo proteinase precursor [Periconia macrospinosa]
MRSFLLGSLAALAVQNANAHPTYSGLSQSSRMLSRKAVDLDSFRLKTKSDYKNSVSIKEDPSLASLVKRADPESTATELVKTTFPGAEFRLSKDQYAGSNGVTHLYFKQTANGLDIDNADFNVNIARSGEVFSFGNSFFKGEIPPLSKKRASVEPAEALKSAVNTLNLPISAESATAKPSGDNSFKIEQTTGTVSEPEAHLVYVVTAEGKLALSWKVMTDIDTDYLSTYIDAADSKVVHHVVNYANDATYEVYPWGINDPTEGSRITVTDPWDKEASEFGWHSTGTDSYNTTRGNNGVAQDNRSNSPQSQYLNLPRPVSSSLDFVYPYSPNTTDFRSYINASVTQLWYTSNTYHDLLWHLGFTPEAGNFETNNNGEGGVGNDFVWLNSQDGAGTNNANFLTPPDGQSGRMRMYMWDNTTPNRDGSFEAGIVIHEYTHGLSNRLTGGPANSNCLNLLEAGGMGEGWSDFYATAIRLKPSDTRTKDYTMGEWASGRALGIRRFPYSTNNSTNPQVYETNNELSRVHDIGGVWATILYEVLWNLIDEYGKNDGPLPEFDENGVPTDGKYLAMKLVLDGMALQPCNPTFVSARDAIVDADEALTGGTNQCLLWKAFAKRGLGTSAVYSATARKGSFEVPAGC